MTQFWPQVEGGAVLLSPQTAPGPASVFQLNHELTWAWHRRRTWQSGCPRTRADSCGDEWHPGKTPLPSWRSRSTTLPCRTRLGHRCIRHCGSPWQPQHIPWPADRDGRRPERSRGHPCWGTGHHGPSLSGNKPSLKPPRETDKSELYVLRYSAFNVSVYAQVLGCFIYLHHPQSTVGDIFICLFTKLLTFDLWIIGASNSSLTQGMNLCVNSTIDDTWITSLFNRFS